VFIFRECLLALYPISAVPAFVHYEADLGRTSLVRREAEFVDLRREPEGVVMPVCREWARKVSTVVISVGDVGLVSAGMLMRGEWNKRERHTCRISPVPGVSTGDVGQYLRGLNVQLYDCDAFVVEVLMVISSDPVSNKVSPFSVRKFPSRFVLVRMASDVIERSRRAP
jgi:hypothetical protein